MGKRFSVLTALALFGLTACGGPGAAPSTSGTSGAQAAPRAHKVLTLGVQNSIKGFSSWLIGTTGGGARSTYEAFINGLVTTDEHANVIGRLAASMPSLDDGSMVVLPDGRLQTTWTLRPNVTWHDGAPFTADDMVFSYEVSIDPGIPSPPTQAVPRMESVTAPDPQTLVITYKSTFYRALDLSFVELWPLPRHLLGDAFAGDKQAFLNLPYWTTENVHLGPYRVADFGLGENVVLQAYDGYFLGRPKIDTINLRAVADPNTMYANVQASSVDIVSELAMSTDLFIRLRDEWKDNGGGTVVQRDGNWFFGNVQYNMTYATVPAIPQDVRIRRGLFEALDLAGLREVRLPGFADTEPYSFMPKSDPRAAAVGEPFARYPYDPARAAADLAEAGWRKDASGHIVDQTGAQVAIPLRTTPSNVRSMDLVAQNWRDIGLGVDEETVSAGMTSDRPYRATFPGIEITAQNNGDQMLPRFDGRLCPQPPAFSGAQGGCYQNPDLDRLIDKLYATVDIAGQGQVLHDIGELFAENVVMLPLYFDVDMAAVRKGVHALDDYSGVTMESPSQLSRNAYLWDID